MPSWVFLLRGGSVWEARFKIHFLVKSVFKTQISRARCGVVEWTWIVRLVPCSLRAVSGRIIRAGQVYRGRPTRRGYVGNKKDRPNVVVRVFPVILSRRAGARTLL